MSLPPIDFEPNYSTPKPVFTVIAKFYWIILLSPVILLGAYFISDTFYSLLNIGRTTSYQLAWVNYSLSYIVNTAFLYIYIFIFFPIYKSFESIWWYKSAENGEFFSKEEAFQNRAVISLFVPLLNMFVPYINIKKLNQLQKNPDKNVSNLANLCMGINVLKIVLSIIAFLPFFNLLLAAAIIVNFTLYNHLLKKLTISQDFSYLHRLEEEGSLTIADNG